MTGNGSKIAEPGDTFSGEVVIECTECPAKSATEKQSEQRITENIQGIRSSVLSVNSVSSVCSVHSVHSVVRDTLPVSLDGWKVSLFKFTRALKFDCQLDGVAMAEIRPYVEQWHKEAGPVIGDVPFSEVWGEVVASWECAKRPAFNDPLAAALAKVHEEDGMPPVPDCVGYDEPVVAFAYRFLFWLALGQERMFFISCRALGERLDVDHTRAWRILKMFEADAVIVCLKRGRMPKASRYRWNGM